MYGKTDGMIFLLNNDTHEASLIEASGDVTVPKMVVFESVEYKVTCIKRYSLSKATSLDFPPDSEVQIIEDNVFSSSKKWGIGGLIKNISIPKSIKILQFGWCKNTPLLTEIKVSPQNKFFKFIDNQFIIGKSDPSNNQFNDLILARRDIQEVKIPSFIQKISDFSFDYCKDLKTVTFSPDSALRLIDVYSFAESKISNITIPKKVTKIRSNSFYKCKELKTVTFSPDSELQIIEEESFSKSGIENITIPKKVSEIGRYAFQECKKLKTVKILSENDQLIIGHHAFLDSSIENINLTKNTVLKQCCFNGCDKLNKITIPPTNKLYKYIDNKFIVTPSDKQSENYDELYFARFYSPILTVPSYVKKFSDFFFDHTFFQSVEFEPDSKIELIEKNLFIETSIERITIPISVKSIGKNAFKNCTFLETVSFLPSSKLEVIHSGAFENSSITTITIPASVKIIGKGAFQFCEQLTTVKFEKNSMIENIEVLAFADSSIETISLPSNLKKITYSVFIRCSGLKKIIIPIDSKLEYVEQYAFSADPGITTTFGYSSCNIENIITPISKFNLIYSSIVCCRYCYSQHFTYKVEIIDEIINLDEIIEDLIDIDSFYLPNAIQVTLNSNRNFPTLIVSRECKLIGDRLKKQKIIYKNKDLLIDVMSTGEFEEFFENKKSIGEGATSIVYKVPNKNLSGTFFALKVFKYTHKKIPTIEEEINKKCDEEDEDDWNNDDHDIDDENNANNIDLIVDFDQLKRFFTEFEILNSLNHPNIVKVFSFYYGDQKHMPATLLEYCGHDLVKSFKKLKGIDLIAVIYEIANAMKYAHKSGIIHRDLKPENILLDNKKHVKICDFGIAAIFDVEKQKRTQTRTHGIGTLVYMAPELYDNNKKYNEKVDIYSFGIVLYYILSKGHLPDINIADVVHGKELHIPSSINPFSTDLIKKCTSFDHHNRPSFAEIVNLIERNNYKLIDGLDDKIENIKTFLGNNK